jgi:sugar lactone lactonase YvrE
MVTTRRGWLTLALCGGMLSLVEGCGSDTVAPSTQPKPQQLWATLGSGAIVMLTPAQLAQSGAPSLPTFTIPGQPINEKTTLDAAGTLWTTDASGYVHAYTASQLAQVSAGGTIVPAITLAIGFNGVVPQSEPAAITFDAQGNMWVADVALSNLYMYPPAQFKTSGAPVPTYDVFRSNAGATTPQIPYLDGPDGMAFDGNGVLWLDVLQGVIGFRPSTLATPSGSPTPDFLLYGTPGVGGPSAVAFDATGNLWVADSPDTIAMFTRDAMRNLGSNPHPTAGQIMIVPGNNSYVETLAFDAAGNLWVATIRSNQLIRFPATQGGVGVQPDVRITLPSDARGLSFDPAN